MTTIYDIAKTVGCAPSTVSKYLTRNGYVSAELSERIAQAMLALDYHYNGLASQLSKQTSNRIGVLVPFLDHPYFQALITAISVAAAAQGKEIVIMPTAYQPLQERRYLSELTHQLVGALIVTSHALPTAEILNYQRFGTLVFCEDLAETTVSVVRTNRTAVLHQLFTRLQATAPTPTGLLLIRDPAVSRSTQEIFQAYQDVWGSAPAKTAIQYGCHNFQEGQAGMRRLLDANPQLSAVVTESDATAAGALTVCQQTQRAVTVIGQGNQLPSQLMQFSSIDQSATAMGQAAVQLALSQHPATRQVRFKINWR